MISYDRAALRAIPEHSKLQILKRLADVIQEVTAIPWKITSTKRASVNHQHLDAIDIAPLTNDPAYAVNKRSDPVLHMRQGLLRHLTDLAAKRSMPNQLNLSFIIAVENDHLHLQACVDQKRDGVSIPAGVISVLPLGRDMTHRYPDSKSRLASYSGSHPGTPKTIGDPDPSKQRFIPSINMDINEILGDVFPTIFPNDTVGDIDNDGDLISLGDLLPQSMAQSGETFETGDIKSANKANAKLAARKIAKKGGNVNQAAIKSAQRAAAVVKAGQKLSGKITPDANLAFIQGTNATIVSVNTIRFDARSRARDIAWNVQAQRSFNPFKNLIYSQVIASGASGTTINLADNIAVATTELKVWGVIISISSTGLAQNPGKLFTVTLSTTVGTASAVTMYSFVVKFVNSTSPMELICLPASQVDGNWYAVLVPLRKGAVAADLLQFSVNVKGGDGVSDTLSVIVPGCEDPYTKRFEAATTI